MYTNTTLKRASGKLRNTSLRQLSLGQTCMFLYLGDTNQNPNGSDFCPGQKTMTGLTLKTLEKGPMVPSALSVLKWRNLGEEIVGSRLKAHSRPFLKKAQGCAKRQVKGVCDWAGGGGLCGRNYPRFLLTPEFKLFQASDLIRFLNWPRPGRVVRATGQAGAPRAPNIRTLSGAVPHVSSILGMFLSLQKELEASCGPDPWAGRGVVRRHRRCRAPRPLVEKGSSQSQVGSFPEGKGPRHHEGSSH